MKFEVYCQHEDFAMTLKFYIFKINSDESRDICTSIDNMEFSRYEEGRPVDPTFLLRGRITEPFLQAMANTLHKIGVTAEGEPVLANELTAVKYHLEDMRRLVFDHSNENVQPSLNSSLKFSKILVGSVKNSYENR
jgi:hypothetical protein